MRTMLILTAAALLAVPALVAASADVTFEGGNAKCIRTGFGAHVSGEATPNDPLVVAADDGTVTIRALGQRVGAPGGDLACTFDVAITGGSAIGVDATSPRATVSPLSSSPCSLDAHGVCIASATAAWAVSELNSRASVSIVIDPSIPPTSSTEVDATSFLSPQNLPSGALGVEVTYDLGVTVDGVRTVVASGAVQIYDSPVGVSVQGNSLP